MNDHDDHAPYPGPADDGATESSDLNRALAEAIIQSAAPPDPEPPRRPAPSTVKLDGCVQWHAAQEPERSATTVLGIDYAPAQMAIVELAVTKRAHRLAGLITTDCQRSPDIDGLQELLGSHAYPEGTEVHLSLTSPRAVVRHFRLPRLSRKQREAAARWEARKLIPFPLDEENAIYGFDFAPDDDGSCRVTLAAVPREDTAGILGIIQELNWRIQSVSVAGTKRCPSEDGSAKQVPAEPTAVVHWSPHRVTFVVFKRDELLFHYDMGLMPLPEVSPGQEVAPELLRKWVRTLGKSITDAFEFYGGANAGNAITHLDLYGLPEAMAPLITDWNERLSIPVQIRDLLHPVREQLPPDVKRWVDRHGAEILPAYLAAVGHATVDLTPMPLRQLKRSRHHGAIARAAFATSLAVLMAWAGLLWTQRTLTQRAGSRLGAELQVVESSPVHAQIQECLARTQEATRLSNMINQHGITWTPALKTIVASLPAQTRLLSLSAAATPDAPNAGSRIRLEGLIYPSNRAHTLILADWLRSLELSFGVDHVKLESTRNLEWKDRRKTAFVLSIDTSPSSAGDRS